MDEVSQAQFALTPVSFRYKKEIDPTGSAQFRLVAEDVAKVNPDLVIHDKEGKPYTAHEARRRSSEARENVDRAARKNGTSTA